MNEILYIQLAREYLLSFDDVTEAKIDLQLNEWQNRKPRNFQDLFKAYLNHSINRRNMRQTIGDIDDLAPILFDFDHHRVLDTYNSWDDLFDKIEASQLVPLGRMKKDKPGRYWVIFCKAILTSAEFLAPFALFSDYVAYVDSYMSDEAGRIELADVIANQVHGMGFALACDLLKETGYTEYVKPDTHVCEISYGLGISTSKDPLHVFQELTAYAHRINKLPYEVDKLFWLVGSGNFYLSKLVVNSSREGYLRFVHQPTAVKYEDLDSLLNKARNNGEARITWDGIEYIIRPAPTH